MPIRGSNIGNLMKGVKVYGVYTLEESKWTLDSVYDDYTEALAYADYLATLGFSVKID